MLYNYNGLKKLNISPTCQLNYMASAMIFAKEKNGNVLSMLFPFRICLKLLTSRLILMVHPVGGLIVRVDGVFVANLCRPRSLLTHVRSSDQLSAEVPALPTRQLHVHGHVIIRFLQARVFILLALSWDSSHT